MSKIAISKFSFSAFGKLSLTRSPIFATGGLHGRVHAQARFFFRPRAHKSASHFRSVWVSFVCHNPPDGHNCDASALYFSSTDFLVESNLFHPNDSLPTFLRAQDLLEAVHLCDRQFHPPIARLTHL